MIILAVHGDVEFSRREVEIVGYGRTLRFRRFQRLCPQVAPFACFEEIPGNRGEEGERQLVFQRRGGLGHVLLEFFKFRFKPVGRSALHGLFVPDGPRHDFFIERPGSPTVEAEEIILGFRGDDLVPLALFTREHVEGGLRADDLAGRRDERRIAHVFADTGDFVHHFFHSVQGVLFGQLRGEIGEHAAGNLGRQNFSVHTGEVAFKLPVLPAHVSEMLCNGLQIFQVQSAVIGRAP